MRYKEYNINRVLEKCTKLFWDNGFRGCSITDITEETDINRFSLYHEFENKEGILYASLKLYRERYCEDKFKILEEKGTLTEVIKTFYLSFLQDSNVIKGCYFIHIGTELASEDNRIKRLVDQYLSEIELLFVSLLQNNKIEIEHSKVLARHLTGLFCTSMGFCLIHTNEQRDKHIETGINVILTNNG
jgi:AcrR family transcriptional regulator